MCEGLRRQARKWKMTWPMATGVGVTLCDDLEGLCFYEIGTWNEGRGTTTGPFKEQNIPSDRVYKSHNSMQRVEYLKGTKFTAHSPRRQEHG